MSDSEDEGELAMEHSSAGETCISFNLESRMSMLSEEKPACGLKLAMRKT